MWGQCACVIDTARIKRTRAYTEGGGERDVGFASRLGEASVTLLWQRVLLQHLHRRQRVGNTHRTTSWTGSKKQTLAFLHTEMGIPVCSGCCVGPGVPLAGEARPVSQTVLMETGEDHTLQR